MAGKLVIFHGLPGSGKSTLARRLYEEDPANSVLVDRDEVRTSLFGEKYHEGNPVKEKERQAAQVCDDLMKEGFRAGKTVISADTNLKTKFLVPLFQKAHAYGATVEQVHVDVPVEECKRRNEARAAAGGRLVPEFIIDSMAKNAYGPDGHLMTFVYGRRGEVFTVPQTSPEYEALQAYNRRLAEANTVPGNAVVLVDVDSTLANNTHHSRRFLGRHKAERDFEAFYEGLREAPVNAHVVALANRMREEEGLNLVVLTGRDDGHSDALISFLERSGLRPSRVVMKRHGDFRPDAEFKEEALKALRQEGLALVHAIDDRPSSIRAMEQEGIMVTRVVVDHEKPYDPREEGPDPTPALNTIYGSGYCIRCGSPLKGGGNIGPSCRRKV